MNVITIDVLRAESLIQSISINVSSVVIEKLNELDRVVNTLYLNNFGAKSIMGSLFMKYKRMGACSKMGFNRSMALGFVFFLFYHLQKSGYEQTVIVPSLKRFLVDKKNIDREDYFEMYELDTSIKVYPFIKEDLRRMKEMMNQLLVETFGKAIIRGEGFLFIDIRGFNVKPFHFCFTIEFLVFLFLELVMDEIYQESYIVPLMKKFIEKMDEVVVID